MTDYLDLIQYGSLDLERSEELFKNQDYNFAAFCAQQGLEKHLKGYLIKFGIFENIEQLGHLQFPKIIEKMIEWMKQKNSESKEDNFKLLEKSIQYFESFKSILEEINESYEKKIIVWKSSLGITLNKQENDISNGLEIKLMKEGNILQNAIIDFFQSDPFKLKNVDIANLDEQQKNLLKKVVSLQNNLTEAAKSPDSSTSKIHQVMNDFEDVIGMFAYGSGKDSLEKEETIELGKYIKTSKSLEWMGTVVESYPHQIISRYPIQIDGKDPIILYRENKENLWKFIQKIKHVCLQIKESCK